MIAVLTMYGWHGVRHLLAMLNYQQRQYRWQEYCATILWSIGKMLSKDYPFPAYGDFINPRPADNRSAQEIVGGLIVKLSAEGGGK